MMELVPRTEPASGYRGAQVALLTQHGKERVLAPIFREALGARIELVSGDDTDRFGTFTREVPRLGNQLEAARAKAARAIELSGLELAVASEGSFSAGPLGLGSWNLELVVFVDTARKLEIIGRSYHPGKHTQASVQNLDELHSAARSAGFPEHALVLRPNDEHDPRCRKGIRSWRDLDREYLAVRRESANGSVFVENDLRAHVHPTRMSHIADAAQDLVRRMRSLCPACGAPGFGVVRMLDGLPCEDCGSPTSQSRGEELGCVACAHRQAVLRSDRRTATAYYCGACNP